MKNEIIEPTEFPFKMDFLDLQIINSGNSDGFVVVKYTDTYNKRHLGNYSTLRDAMKGAFLYFMIDRPQHFHSQIFHRLIGMKTYYEWFTFKKVCEEANIIIPESIYISGNINCTIASDFEDALIMKAEDISMEALPADKNALMRDITLKAFDAKGNQIPFALEETDIVIRSKK